MRNKREKMFQAVERLHGLVCLVCGQAMQRQENDLTCPRGHCVNVHRKGCINALSRHAEGCYDDALFEARGRVPYKEEKVGAYLHEKNHLLCAQRVTITQPVDEAAQSGFAC